MSIDRVLVIAPHPDDETLGVGGTIAKFVTSGSEVFVLTVAGHLPPLYDKKDYKIIIEEAKKAYEILGVKNFKFLDIPATFVNELPVHELNQKILSVIDDFSPNIVFAPFPDRHIDHRVIFESTMVATRPVGKSLGIRLVACYETLSETHWNAPYLETNFSPNYVVDIDKYIGLKLDALRCYKSQISLDSGPRSIKSVNSLAHFRGSQSGFEYAEAFFITRMTG
jgi:N-acetylglucosamine malate deacetylase 1